MVAIHHIRAICRSLPPQTLHINDVFITAEDDNIAVKI
jgi:hypothetical protein